MNKKKYIVAAVLLIAVVLGGLAYSGFDFSKLTGAINSAVPVKPALSISVTNAPASDILIAGSANVHQQLVSRYSLRAFGQDVTLDKLTVINDLSGAFDAPVNTNAVALVTLKYPTPLTVRPDGATYGVGGGDVLGQGILSNGAVTFLNLDFIIPKNTTKNIEIYADITPMNMVGESLSGSNFRLGIQDTQNTAATFNAIAFSSSTSVSPTFANSSNVKPFTVRKSKPDFTSVPVSTALKQNTENAFYAFNVAANIAGSVSLARLVFDVNVAGFAYKGADISTFRLYRGSTMMPTSNVNIYCTNVGGYNSTEIASSTLGFCDGMIDDGIATGAYKIIVSFNVEETVAAGLSQTYYLKGMVTGASSGSMVVTKIATGDDNVALSGLTANINSNTGKIFVSGDATSGIITNGPANFSLYPIARKNILWSDMSAEMHQYPTIASGNVTNATGSYDWTNGYLLKTAALPAVTLSY